MNSYHELLLTRETLPTPIPRGVTGESHWPIIKCGEHNENGLRIGGIFMPNQDLPTQEGEWPHVCLIFENRKIIGSASLIAPKVLVTAAHLLE